MGIRAGPLLLHKLILVRSQALLCHFLSALKPVSLPKTAGVHCYNHPISSPAYALTASFVDSGFPCRGQE